MVGTPIDLGSLSSGGIAYYPDNKMMYVSSFDGSVVKVINTDTNTVTTSVQRYLSRLS